MHGFKDSVPVCKLYACMIIIRQGMQKFQAKQNRVGSSVQGKSSIYQVLKSINRLESHSTLQNIFQYYYQSYCDYLLKLGCTEEEQAIFEQLTLSDFKK